MCAYFIIQNLMNSQMEEEILGEEEDFQMAVNDQSTNPDDIYFNAVVQALQEIIIDDLFQKNQTGFMRDNCFMFENTEENKNEYMMIFQQYQSDISTCLESMLREAVPNFQMSRFASLLSSHSSYIDEQIVEILTSFSDFQVFKQMMLDYKASLQQEQRYRILTVKTNKIPQQKKVKGASDNIFGGKQFSLEKQSIKKKAPPKVQKIQKNEQQLLVPDLVLTIRPLKKQ